MVSTKLPRQVDQSRIKLLAFGFTHSVHDHCLFYKISAGRFLALVVYVDDVLLSGSHEEDIAALKLYLDQFFTIKDLGFAKYFLGIELARGSHGLYLNQRKYVLDILTDVGMLDCKPASTPLPTGLKLVAKGGVPLPSPDRYKRLICCLFYLNMTRPDITYNVHHLSRFINAPTSLHWDVALHALRYLKGSPSTGLFYPSSGSFSLEAFSDADWGACQDTMRSLTGYCFFFGGCLVAWKTKKQNSIATSTAEVKYIAAGSCCAQVLWMRQQLRDYEVEEKEIPIMCDNTSAIAITQNPMLHSRTKHIDVRYHFIRDHVEKKDITLEYISTDKQLADIFTKPLCESRFEELKHELGLIELS
ncbi:hypothetical protein DH2020_046661 [Rehmannia glutinosa]|uniref:Reverse transcriptase Ty1/copia-type domain-containing protein n=1 Tax=Rehmannia glutinosa TaxID=99300 RepID=A0ABR0UBG5_REHGL